ncbi:hypothetical protein [Clostridium folliculivorans]|uniref:hypothetical protein n=1 Tax=Clostridium folliculivorans TaxID=2886038 RepID=UPI0021C46A3F|nr:hypothetical protein [Clostridium folliculivorans]GKU30429.1 hypothetical protein CFB3_25360 [Clostridium folliculivorans]
MDVCASEKCSKITKYMAFSRFKEDVGNNNQMLITACIGLDKIDKDDVGKKQPSQWQPLDWKNSVERSRLFVIKAGLTWTIDCLDVLLKDFFSCFFDENDHFIKFDDGKIIRKCNDDKYDKIQNKNEKDLKYTEIYKSVYNKYRVIEDLFLEKESEIIEWRRQSDFRVGKKESEPYFPKLELIFALLDLAIQWRNHLVHGGADNRLKQNTTRILKKYEEILNSNTYGTLEIDLMLKHFRNRSTPSFKEVSVLIRNIIDFGFVVNAYWINCVNKDKYINKCLTEILPLSLDEIDEYKKTNGKNDDKIEFFYRIQTLTPERIRTSICMKLSNKGMVLQESGMECLSKEDECIIKYLRNLKLIE